MPRQLIKTLTYSLMHFTVAIAVAFALTRNWHAALDIGMWERLPGRGRTAPEPLG